jgi:hypothetical protein
MAYAGVQVIDTNPKRTPLEQLEAAVAGYREKYGLQPARVLVRPGAAEWPEMVDGVPVKPSKTVSYPNQFFLVRAY